jgi:tetratricopeptide (TPR) repeat protein
LGTADGLWVGGADRTVYFRTADFLDAAKAAGRVMTTAEVRRRKQQLANDAGALAAARFDLSLRNFDGVLRKAETVLAARPGDPQALLLMAVLHDFWCLNRPDQAMAWYRKLSALESDRSALYTGLYGEFRIHYALGQWDQAVDSGERLLDKIPVPGGRRTAGYSSVALTIESFMRDARQKRNNPSAKAERTAGD